MLCQPNCFGYVFMSGGDVAKLFLFGICALNYCGIKTEASFNRKIVSLHKPYLDF